MSNHTPGPWRFNESAVHGSDHCPQSLCLINQGKENCHLNGLLIAAAPEMLEALKECDSPSYTDFELDVLAACGTGMGEIAPDRAKRYQLVRAAIAKAEGGAE